MADTIGRQLKKAREARNLSIEKVTQATLLRARHIEALEADDFESLPSPVQARAFLRIYAEFLGLSVDELIANQKASAGQPGEEIPVPPEIQAPVVEMKAPEPEPAQVEEEILPETAEEGKIPLRERARNWLAGVLDRLRTRFKPAEFDELDEAGLVPEPVEAAIPEEPSEPDRQVGSQEIFTSIGEILRDRRESLSLTLDEIERHTHVRKHYLQALEEGQFERLPSSVQTRGMLNNYAHFMDMDVDAILLKYADGLQAQLQERQPRPAEKPQKSGLKQLFTITLPPTLRRYLSIDILVGSGLVLMLIIFTIWGINRVIGLRSAETPEPTAPSISDVLVGSPQAETWTPSPTNPAQNSGQTTANATQAITVSPVGSGAVQVVVVAQQSAWVRVTVDGKQQFEGRVQPGATYPFGGNQQIEVLTGDGSAIQILYNQADLGTMGTLGQVVDRIYTATAILNPTATFTPSPTITPIPSITLRPSITPRISPTPPFSLTPTY